MSKAVWVWLIPATALLSVHAENLDGLNEAVGVNQTVEEGFGARQSGMATTFAPFQRNADAVANSPASMNDVDDFTFSTSHAEKFGEAKFDDFAFLFPLESRTTLGLGLSRYGVSGIENWPEGSNPLASQPPEVFSIADYLVVGAFARRWGGFDLGLNLNILYRHLDQDGIGMRGDGMAQYTWADRFRVSALMKGLVPSSASWESGYAEYEAPEIYLGGATRLPAPYFYGTLEAAWQSEGLFHRTARSVNGLNASRAWDKPADFFAASNLGLEFDFDFGLAVRVGISEFSSSAFTSVASLGVGYTWRHIVGLDYSFTPHPDLLSTHRVSLEFTPSFPKFQGRDYRYRGSPRPVSPNPSGPSEANPESEEESGTFKTETLEPEGVREENPPQPVPAATPPSSPPAPKTDPAQPGATPATPPAVPISPTAPSGSKAPTTPAAPAPPTQAAPAPVPAKAAKPQPAQGNGGEKEIIDNEDEGQ